MGSSTPAIAFCHSILYCPKKIYAASWRVKDPFEPLMMSRGKITWANAGSGLQPSMEAQSSISLGTVFTKPWYMKRDRGAPSPQ
jgi:hypothetical protein